VTLTEDPTWSVSCPVIADPDPSRVSTTQLDPVQKACRSDLRVAS
jgi:hypothetical protein